MFGSAGVRGSVLDDIGHMARPADDLDSLLDAVGDAHCVLLGEATHGTSEFYSRRAEISRRLIEEKGFDFVAVEGDWPDCWRIDRWVKGKSEEPSSLDVLDHYERWPTWMWANHEIAAFISWMREHNDALPDDRRVGFYGLDVYSLWDSLDVALAYVRTHRPDAADAVREAARCFEPYRGDAQGYAWATSLMPTTCEQPVLDMLVQARMQTRPELHDDESLDLEQNAEVVAGAERYYRTMLRSDASSWNVRDIHMTDTLDRLFRHHGEGSKAIIWEHNTHIGDARATDMAAAGMVNVGQLVRERHPSDSFALGFGTYEGHVIAGPYWGADMERMPVPPARDGSHEALIHEAVGDDALFVFGDTENDWLTERRAHRAIGVVYHPEEERRGNYVPTVLGRRYDAFMHLDHTEALHPVHTREPFRPAEMETYPSSM